MGLALRELPPKPVLEQRARSFQTTLDEVLQVDSVRNIVGQDLDQVRAVITQGEAELDCTFEKALEGFAVYFDTTPRITGNQLTVKPIIYVTGDFERLHSEHWSSAAGLTVWAINRASQWIDRRFSDPYQQVWGRSLESMIEVLAALQAQGHELLSQDQAAVRIFHERIQHPSKWQLLAGSSLGQLAPLDFGYDLGVSVARQILAGNQANPLITHVLATASKSALLQDLNNYAGAVLTDKLPFMVARQICWQEEAENFFRFGLINRFGASQAKEGLAAIIFLKMTSLNDTVRKRGEILIGGVPAVYPENLH
jgi:hypothetical protein